MYMENIICPNCGAQNHHYGTCEYCGTTIRKPKTTTTKKQNDAESFAQKIAKYQKIEPFIGGVAVVSIGELQGAINEQGDIVVPLSSSYVYNYDGRLLIRGGTNKVLDAHGNILAEANVISYIGNGEYLLTSGGKEQILNQKNELLAVKLPKGISISVDGSLGYGCYLVVSDDSYINFGIALRDRLLLPCNYEIEYLSRYGKLGSENRNLLKIKQKWKGTYNHGIFDLEKRLIVLPCQYYFDTDYKDKYKDRLLIIQNGKGYYGVFDVKTQELVIQPEYKQVVILDNRVCEVTKKGFFGSKTTTIQL